MQQQISVVTLGVSDLARSRRFYVEGFGWSPVFENEEIIFCQMNGFVLGTWLRHALAADMRREDPAAPGLYSLAHNVASRADVQATMDRLSRCGGRIMRPADEPPHGGCAAMWPIPTSMHGRSRGIPPGPSMPRDM